MIEEYLLDTGWACGLIICKKYDYYYIYVILFEIKAFVLRMLMMDEIQSKIDRR